MRVVVTCLATAIKTQKQVVIKQFQFARSQSNWNYRKADRQKIKS